MPVTALDPKAEAGRKPTVWWPSSLPFTVPAATAEWVSVALGGVLFALIGIALSWADIYVGAAAIGFSLCTVLSRSLSRALISVFAGLGLLAAILAIFSGFAPSALETISIPWSALFALWLILAIAASALFRWSGAGADFGAAEIFGSTVGILVAAIISVKLNFHGDLLPYLLNLEDNAAWVGVTTAISANSAVTPQFQGQLGPMIPLLLGLFQTAQQSGVPVQNATVAAYAVPVIIAPLVVTSLVRKLPGVAMVVAVAFSAVAVAWAYAVPLILYSDFGHLSAIWVFLGFLTLTSFVMFDRGSPWTLPVGLSLTAFVGATWFPVSPLAGAIAVGLCVPFLRKSGVGAKVLIGLALAAGIVILSVQPDSLGLNLDSVAGIKELFTAAGGTAVIEPIIIVLVLGGTIALASLTTAERRPQAGLLSILIGLATYLVIVYALSNLLAGGSTYGVPKMTYILTSVSVVSLIAVIPRFSLPAGPIIATVVALSLMSFLWGGSTQLLKRTWPGELSKPAWLAPVEAVVASQRGHVPRPIACLSSAPMDAYICTRWASALTRAGDGDLVPYRFSLVGGGDISAPTGAIADLRKTGVLKQTDLILLSPPDLAVPWNRAFVSGAGALFDASGQRVSKRNIRRAMRAQP